MTSESVPDVWKINLTTAKYHKSNQTYDITGLVSGAFIDMTEYLQNKFNFSLRWYRRQHDQWGMPTVDENGTMKSGGIISNSSSE